MTATTALENPLFQTRRSKPLPVGRCGVLAQEHWVWHSDWNWYSDGDGGGHWEDDGECVDEGQWMFDLDRYQASLSASMAIKPDDKSPTASGTVMKSGYGITETVSARVSTNQSSAVTK